MLLNLVSTLKLQIKANLFANVTTIQKQCYLFTNVKSRNKCRLCIRVNKNVSQLGKNKKFVHKGKSGIKEKGRETFGLTIEGAGALTDVDLPTQRALSGY